jgi:isopenicillin N synthase-like dioxygenase
MTQLITPDGAFIVNLGDLMMRWTNDRWRSTLHRVVNPPTATNDLSRRLSIGMFFIPNYDAVVAPIAGLGEASKYPQPPSPITAPPGSPAPRAKPPPNRRRHTSPALRG